MAKGIKFSNREWLTSQIFKDFEVVVTWKYIQKLKYLGSMHLLIGNNYTNNLFKLLRCVCVICIMIACIFTFFILEKISDRLFLRTKYIVSVRAKYCTVIVRNPFGRLGNVLFGFATAYGLSLDHSCHLYIGPNVIRELGQYFEINLPNLLTESELNRILSIQQIYNHCTYFPELFHPNKSQNIELIGFWQVHKYFVNHTNQIRNQLRFKETILSEAKNFIKTNISSTISNLVGIHIRRGDFIGLRQISSDKFIFDAMTYYKRKYGSVKFIFVSDDKSYCRNVFGKRNDTFFTPDSFNPAMDMAVVTLCDHAIITVGTYGWWAGFLLHNRTGEILTDAKPNHNPLDVDCESSIFFPSWFSFLNVTK
jgi:galactoside 2-L-fucosyltransferase 1/2